jgi:uncharacterized damage-inducible protein DinB
VKLPLLYCVLAAHKKFYNHGTNSKITLLNPSVCRPLPLGLIGHLGKSYRMEFLMTKNILIKLFEHNNWANQLIIQACATLSDEQLDAEPESATKGSIRLTLSHLVASQQGYLSLLTPPVETKPDVRPTFTELREAATTSGEGLLALVKEEPGRLIGTQLKTKDGYLVEPWVILVQVINHATEHREQIKSMLSSLGVTPPDIDGWDYGEATNALIPIST